MTDRNPLLPDVERRDWDGMENLDPVLDLERDWNGRALAERDWVTPRTLAAETDGSDASLAHRICPGVKEAHLQNASAISLVNSAPG